MQALRVHPAPPGSTPYSPTNPAPPSAIHLDKDVQIPKPSKPGELLVRVKASTVVRDMLTWPETYHHEYAIPGNDLSGVVVKAYSDSKFRPGDEVFGMADADRGATWAEFTIVEEKEIALKSTSLTWEKAAALPLSAQTAYEALFDHAGVSIPNDRDITTNKTKSPDETRQKVLITGAAGGVGVYLMQLASLAGLHVVAATSSNDRNAAFLRTLGADETIEYDSLKSQDGLYDLIADTVGGDVLATCWKTVKDKGTLITVDSSSVYFVDEHKTRGLCKDGVKALFFIVSGGTEALHFLAHYADLGVLQVFLLAAYPLAEAQEAYEQASRRHTGRGKIVLTV